MMMMDEGKQKGREMWRRNKGRRGEIKSFGERERWL